VGRRGAETHAEHTVARQTEASTTPAEDMSMDAKREIALASGSNVDRAAELLRKVEAAQDGAAAGSEAGGEVVVLSTAQLAQQLQLSEADLVYADIEAALAAYNSNVRRSAPPARPSCVDPSR
jgi:beta-phosphoglucomutase-like phosphatase (HAD superfamily)